MFSPPGPKRLKNFLKHLAKNPEIPGQFQKIPEKSGKFQNFRRISKNSGKIRKNPENPENSGKIRKNQRIPENL